MRTLFMDYESFYSQEFSLRKMTPAEYVLDQRFECIGAAVKEELNGESYWVDGSDLPYFFKDQDPNNTCLVSHNALFDMCITSWRYRFRPARMIDTLGMARAMLGYRLKSLSLASVAQALGIGVKGDTIHKVLGMNAAAIQQSGLYNDYIQYAINDVELCAGIYDRLIRAGFPEQEMTINDMVLRCAIEPQFLLDQTVLAEHLATIKSQKEQLIASVGADKSELMSNDKFAELLRRHGVEPPLKTSMVTGKVTYAFAKTDPAFVELEEHDDPAVQALVAARVGHKSTLEETRTERFIKISHLHWPDGGPQRRMPMPLRYSGAHTHRLSGDWKLNVQNLNRGGALRRALIAPPGHKVLAVDASQIEARMVAWECGQRDLVQKFADGVDVYSDFATRIFGRPITKADKAERFLGKTCLAEGTLVYTDRGLVPIEHVTRLHKLWDGEEWVCHQGLTFNGLKKTVDVCGISLTPDHLVLCGTKWQRADSLLADENTLCLALDTAAASSRSLVTCEVTSGFRRSSCGAIAADPNTQSTLITSRHSAARDATSVLTTPWRKNASGDMPTQCQTTRTGHGCSIALPQRSRDAIRQARKRLTIMAGAAFRSIRNGVTTALHSCVTSRLCPAGMSRNLRWTASTWTATTRPTTSALSVGLITSRTNDKSRPCRSASLNSKQNCRVYDLVNAGPRHRFMVHTESGPLIVHNCILGMGYGVGWEKFQRTVKLQSKAQTGQQIDLDDVEAQRIVNLYRSGYAAIPAAWRTLNNAIPLMLKDGGGFTFGPCVFEREAIRLPSELRLHYHKLRQEQTERGYQWVCEYGGKPKKIYGGAVLENITQALARIVVMDVAIRLRSILAIYDVQLALQVHDELVYVVPEDVADLCKQLALEEMSRPPAWAPDLPLAAEADVGPSYGDAK